MFSPSFVIPAPVRSVCPRKRQRLCQRPLWMQEPLRSEHTHTPPWDHRPTVCAAQISAFRILWWEKLTKSVHFFFHSATGSKNIVGGDSGYWPVDVGCVCKKNQTSLLFFFTFTMRGQSCCLNHTSKQNPVRVYASLSPPLSQLSSWSHAFCIMCSHLLMTLNKVVIATSE